MDRSIVGKSMTLNTDKYLILKQRNWICDVTPLQKDFGFIPISPSKRFGGDDRMVSEK
jgi:hypothetical protein